jgi:hypothetical protein
MNKKGVFLEIGALIIIIITSVGLIVTAMNSSTLIVGDSSTHKYFSYYKCKTQANQITESNLVIFNSEQDATQKGYNATQGCN